MRRFHVAILVGLARLNPFFFQPVVIHQTLVTRREFLGLRKVVHCRAQAIGSVPDRDSTKRPNSILKTFAQAFKTLRKTDIRPLPIRVRQHEVKHHVIKSLTCDRDRQTRHVRKVRSTQPSRFVNLAEEDLFVWTRCRSPATNSTLKCSQLAVLKLARMLSLKPGEENLRLQSWILRQLFLDRLPHR